jgi:septal ring factor EnvC (AmiA/AmiB activator)
MLLADVTPGLQAQAEVVRSQLLELNDLRSLQAEASKTLTKGLDVAIAARSALSQAISNRTELPKKLTEDPEVLRGLLESADTLEAFAAGLVLEADASSGFADAKGNLALPVLGKLVLLAGETDAYGVTRPGLSFATRAGALVQNPWPATIRYSGPLLDYGNVMILEPGEGYLLIVAGLDQVYGTVGEVIAKGAPLGLMGGSERGLADISASQGNSGVLSETQTLYLELRQGSKAIDPIDWFAATATAGE